jgi:hypothetical protein
MEYFLFIQEILKQNRTKQDGELYYLHHIFPRSLYPLLKNKSWNWVYLTPAEHAKAHYLLSKCTVGKCQERMKHVYDQYFGYNS